MTSRDQVAERFDAELRETEACLEVLEAEADARKAKEEMAEISGLNATRQRARQKLTELKRETKERAETVRSEIEALLRDLKTGIRRVGDRFAAWDAARERRFNALLEEAEAWLKERESERSEYWHDVLATLRRQGPPFRLRPTDLTEATMLTSSGTTKRLDKLENAGLIAREPDPQDRRGVLIALTDKGRATIDATTAAHLANERRLLAALTPDEQRQLADLLRKLLLGLPD